MALLRFKKPAIVALLSSLTGVASSALAEDILEGPPQPVVVEMFVSQACEQCPAAAEYLTDLAERDDVVALAWHVDYWDNAMSYRHGRWKDPFASPAYSERQRLYNKKLRGRRSIFTPQAIVNGAKSIVGSKRDNIEKSIEAMNTPGVSASIRFDKREDKKMQIAIDNLPSAHNVYLVSFYEKAETPIHGGANAGITFVNANIVDGIKMLDATATSLAPVLVEAPVDGMGCAVIVQTPDQGAIAAAAYCPTK